MAEEKVFSFQDVADSLKSISAKLERVEADGGPDIGGAVAEVKKMLFFFESHLVRKTGPNVWSDRNC